MTVRTSPCDWPLAHCGEGGESCASLAGLGADVAALVEQAAQEYLWRWTGRRFGTCSLTVRPCREECYGGSTYRGPGWFTMGLPYFGQPGGGVLNPALIGGAWFNRPCGDCAGRCACSEVQGVTLGGPVVSVESVLLSGVELAPNAYRVDNNVELVRLDGGRWPACQDMTAALGEADTFGVTYTHGIAVPAGGQLAAGVLACQLAKAVCGDRACRLPQNVATVSRQGVTITLLQSNETMYDHGTTGLWAVDSWVASVNSTKHTGGRVYSPDIGPRRRTTYTP